ncbi:hypothetical protein SKAU_G00363570 [Synaphobranchus kaupii]|uniref:Uncharacterized protein n=1 Tax=Synaphobranchus kaupii TaxID=118154 RepID=A0A9Q1IHB9_SYNKA|nr:hypothetical protein SKAU_G00363570 [Synaphobranchus kaupii]
MPGIQECESHAVLAEPSGPSGGPARPAGLLYDSPRLTPQRPSLNQIHIKAGWRREVWRKQGGGRALWDLSSSP